MKCQEVPRQHTGYCRSSWLDTYKGTEEKPRNSVQARSQGLRHRPGESFHGYSAVKVVMSRAADRSYGKARQMTFIGS